MCSIPKCKRKQRRLRPRPSSKGWRNCRRAEPRPALASSSSSNSTYRRLIPRCRKKYGSSIRKSRIMNTKRTTNQSADESEAQDIATLKKRYEKLQTEKTRAETKLESAQKELQNLKKDAKKDYGTDELPALQKKLQDMKEQNEKKRAAYQKSLEKVENELREVEAKYDTSKEEG